MTPWLVIYAIAAGQALLLAAALWRRPNDRQANRFLAAWMLLVFVDLTVRAWAQHDQSLASFKPMRMVALFPFLHASAFYIYVRTLIHATPLRWRDTLHAAGFLFALTISLPLFLMSGAQIEQALATGHSLGFCALGAGSSLILFGFSLSYIAVSVVAVLKQRKQLRDTQSDRDPGELRWLMAVAVSQCGIWAVALAQLFLPNRWIANELIYVAVSAWVLLAGYLSLLNAGPPARPATAPQRSAAEDPDGNASADLDPRFDDVAKRLSALMDQGIYREIALSIAQLAQRSGYPEYLVSAVINRRFGYPFWDYVNRFRVDAAKRCLADPQDQRTALEIAYDCGFSSKSTFNSAFKRFAGQTPSQYRAAASGQPA